MSRSAVFVAFALTALTACDAQPDRVDPAAVDLQSLEAIHLEDGAPAFRLEATFVGAHRRGEVQALLDAVEVVPVDEVFDGRSTGEASAEARAEHAIEQLAAEGGEAVVLQVHPLRPQDAGESFGYRLTVEDVGVAPAEEEADGLTTRRSALSISPGGLRMHDLWCYGLRVRYRVRSGYGLFSLAGPFGVVPLPTFPAWQWADLTFFFPVPWPSPWAVTVINTESRRWLYYDMQLSCAL